MPTEYRRILLEGYPILAQLVAEKTTAEWTELLRKADIPMTNVLSPADLLSDPHLASIDFFHEEDHPSEGRIRTIGIPVRFSRTPGSIRSPAPRMDEHRAEILEELKDQN